MKHLQKIVAIFLIGFCLLNSASIKSQPTLQIKEFYDDMGEFQMDMDYYSPLTTLTKVDALEPISYKLESYIKMYQTTRDKAYLYKFIEHVIRIQSLRGTYPGPFDCESCTYHGVVSWSPRFYQNGIILWPMAHFIHLIRKEEPALQNMMLNPHSDIDFSSVDYSNFGEFADWLAGRVKETIEHYRNNYWYGDDKAFGDQPTHNSHDAPLHINMQSAFGATLLYMGLAWDPGYIPYAKKMAELYKSNVLIEDECNDFSYSEPVLQIKLNNSYWWYHSGWRVSERYCCFWKGIIFECSWQKDKGYINNYEDVSHGAQTLIFPWVAYKHQLSSGATPYFTFTEMIRFRNTMAKNVWKEGTTTGFWNAIIGGTDCDVPLYDCLPNYHRRFTLAWMPFYKFDIYDAKPKPLYEILMDYYEFDVHDKPMHESRGMEYNALAEVVAAQWDKECSNLTLKNRQVVYDQDFFAQNNLIIEPTAPNDFDPANPNSFADPIITEDKFIIEPGVTVNMSAGKEIIFSDGFVAEGELYAFIDPSLACNPGSNKVSNVVTVNNTDEFIENKIEPNKQYDNTLVNYPNPFNASIIFEYSLIEKNNITLTIHNIFGEEVTKLINNQPQEKGTYKIEFNTSDLPKGIYFYTLQTNNNKITRKMMKVE